MCTVQWLSGQNSAADTKATHTKQRCSDVEVIDTQILWLSSWYVWPLRNIHISNNNGFFPIYADFFFPISPTRLLPDLIIYMSNTYKKHELLVLASTWAHPWFWVGSVLIIFVVFCVVFFVLFVRPVSCVPNVVSFPGLSILDCPFCFF